MFLTDRKIVVPALLLALLLFVAGSTGCGLRQSQTGSLSSRVIDVDGNAVVNAEVFSIFSEREKVLTGLDGGFYLSELPAGINNIVILHPDYALEERQIEIRSDDATVIDFIKLDRANAPHRISNVKVVSVASTSATIAWTTYRSVICNVDYGTSQFYGNLYRELRSSSEHTAILKDLSPETVYHFRVQYLDESSVSHYSYDFSFKTGDADRPFAASAIRLLPFSALGMIDIEWDAATSGQPASGYNIYRQIKGGNWEKLNEAPIDARNRKYSDQTVTSGIFCRYAVTAVNNLAAESEMLVSDTVFVPGVINQSVVLSAADSPVKLYSDLIVAAGISLTVEAGTEFLISETDSFASGHDEQRVEILVHGRLAVLGSEAAPVVFAPLDGSGRRDHWAGIRILSSLSGVSEVSHAQMFGCSGFALDVSAINVRVANLSVAHSYHGLLLNGVREVIDLTSCSFSEIASVAVELRNCRRVSLTNSVLDRVHTGINSITNNADDQVIVRNTDINALNTGIRGLFGRSRIINVLIVCPDGTGINGLDAMNERDNYIDHVTIDAMRGIEINKGNFVIENCIVVNRSLNGITGIANNSELNPEYGFNNIFGFTAAYRGCLAGTGAMTIDPLFAGGNPFDYHLLAESTLKLEDRYGSEMGRYGTTRL